jgi:uncharacterized protein (DUF433 family)
MKLDRITVNPARMNGQPCIRNLRLTVKRVIELVALYPDRAELFREYPELEEEDIRQALTYAAIPLDAARPDVPAPHLREQKRQVEEAAAVYDVAISYDADGALRAAIGGVALRLAQLPAEDIFSAAQFVSGLQQRRLTARQQSLSPAGIVTEARRQADLLSDVPRAEVAERFAVLTEEIRQQAIAQDMTFNGDWLGD